MGLEFADGVGTVHNVNLEGYLVSLHWGEGVGRQAQTQAKTL
jgi:hypothetical protein